ncbi:MAG: 50S ribosomal protein L22 [Gemmatimonadetes bacterium]|nr:MAG: 50S ribosomal protein L22 [Gemmatimonadota bacterium]
MEAKATTRYVRISPRKMRQVIDLIRGKDVESAYQILRFTPKRAAYPIYNTLRSAVSNIGNIADASGVEVEDLYVKKIFVNEGPTFRGRFRPRAMGRATRIRRRTSHLTIVVAEKN